MKRNMIEARMQRTICEWLDWHDVFYFSIPNEGKRSEIGGLMMKRMGLKKGASDLFIGEKSSCKKFSAYFLEVKPKGKKPRPEQIQFMNKAREKGYKADCFDDLDMAIESLEEYLGIKPIKFSPKFVYGEDISDICVKGIARVLKSAMS